MSIRQPQQTPENIFLPEQPVEEPGLPAPTIIHPPSAPVQAEVQAPVEATPEPPPALVPTTLSEALARVTVQQQVLNEQGEVLPASRLVKAAFRNLGSREFSPRSPDRCRMILEALRKQGKTTFVCGHPDGVVLDFEGGAGAVKRKRAFVVNILPTQQEVSSGRSSGFNSLDPWARYLEIRDLLLHDVRSGHPQFSTVCIDSVDHMFELMMLKFCAGDNQLQREVSNISDYKDGRAGWYELRTKFMQELQKFDNAGYGLIMCVHQKETYMKQQDTWTSIREWKLPPSFRDAMMTMADQICTIERTRKTERVTITNALGRQETVAQPRTVFLLHTTPRPNDEEAGCRIEFDAPLELPEDGGYTVYSAMYEAKVNEVRRAVSPQQ